MQQSWQKLVGILAKVLPNDLGRVLEETGREIWRLLPSETAEVRDEACSSSYVPSHLLQEIMGCANAVYGTNQNVLYGSMTLANLGYELRFTIFAFFLAVCHFSSKAFE